MQLHKDWSLSLSAAAQRLNTVSQCNYKKIERCLSVQLHKDLTLSLSAAAERLNAVSQCSCAKIRRCLSVLRHCLSATAQGLNVVSQCSCIKMGRYLPMQLYKDWTLYFNAAAHRRHKSIACSAVSAQEIAWGRGISRFEHWSFCWSVITVCCCLMWSTCSRAFVC